MTVEAVSPGADATVVGMLRRAAAINGDVEAYVEPQMPELARRVLTFGDWDLAADGLSGLLERLGVGRGDVVALVLPSSIDYAVAYAAAARRGAVTSGINPRLGPAEVRSILDRARPSVTVVDRSLGVSVDENAGRVVEREEAVAAWASAGPRRAPVLDPTDAVAVVWTSGTTGRPKGAVFDHRCLEAVAAGADVLSAVGDRRLSPLPFAHVGAMTKVWDEIAHAITTVITPTPWRADEALSVMVAERVTVAQGVPTQWALIRALPELAHADLSALRIAGTGAAPMPASDVAELRRRLGVPIVVRYTSTETAVCTGTTPEDPDDVVATTVGRPVPGVELVIEDDAAQRCSVGEPGRIRVRSRATMRGYWADRPHRRAGEGEPPHGTAAFIDPLASAAVLDGEGWVTTGDFGYLDAAGNLHLVGREHERYLRGGYNVYPVEVEDVLCSHRGVDRAAVVGAPDPVLGEVGVAFVVPAPGVAVPGLAELREYCAERLADYKAPDALVVVDELPLTPMMKVDKRSLVDAAGAAAGRRRAAGEPASKEKEQG